MLPNKESNNGEELPLILEDNHFIKDKRQFEIARLGQKAIYITDINSFLFDVVNIVQKSLNIDYVTILKLSGDQTKLKMIQGVGWKEGTIGNISIDVDFTTQAGYTLTKKKPIIVENFNNETRFSAPKLFRDHNVVSGLSIIILGKKKPFGVLGAHSKQPIKFTQDDLNFLLSVSFILTSIIIQQEVISNLKEEEEK